MCIRDRHSGINNATLRNVTIGDDCMIENVGNFINNYTIGDDCYISNISTMETTEGATYGEGNLVSVLNEVDVYKRQAYVLIDSIIKKFVMMKKISKIKFMLY